VYAAAIGSELFFVIFFRAGHRMADGDDVVVVPPHLLSRLLYANPVCILTAVDDGRTQCGLMVLSWLTAINNHGLFFASINSGRHTAAVLMAKETKEFVLSVPVQGMEPTLAAQAKCSSRETNKFATFGFCGCRPGWTDLDSVDLALITPGEHPVGSRSVAVLKPSFTNPLGPPATPSQSKLRPKRNSPVIPHTAGLIAIAQCVAHLVCTLDKVLDDTEDHWQLRCQINAAYVRRRYWTGNTFRPTEPGVPPYLTFFGGGEFGIATPLPPHRLALHVKAASADSPADT